MLQEHHVCDATTSCDVPSRSIRMSEAEDTSTSCQLGLDHPSSKLSMSMCLLPHDWLKNISIGNGRRKQRCRADAGADEPFGRTINGFVTYTHRSTRAAAGDGPTASRTRRVGGPQQLQVETADNLLFLC